MAIENAVPSHRPGWTLDRAFYSDPKIFELDVDRILMRHWLLAGHISRIPKKGDYFVVNVGGESIILIRGDNDQVHALFNVGRHRGSRLCRQDSGNATQLVCPYHAWVYATDGRLLAARHMPADFDRSQFGLHRGHA
ncbi:MAG: (2Fe-2S)-binding protein, partial [Acidobacteria bacterium]